VSTGPQENLVAFEDYAAAVKRRRKLIVVVVVAFVLLGVGVTLVSTKQYTAESRVLVEPVAAPGDTSAEPVNVDTERGVAKSLAVADIAAGIMGNGAEASDLISHVAVDPVSESSILEIRYTATSPQRAYKGADAFAEAYLQFRSNEADEATREARRQLEDARDEKAQRVADLNQQLAGLDPGSVDYNQVESQRQVAQSAQNELQRQLDALDTDSADVGTVIDPAEVPSSPSSPNLVLNVGGAAVIGLIIALSLTFVLERRNLGAAPAVAAPSAPDPEPEPAMATVPTRSPAVLAAPASSPPLPARIERPVASTPAPAPVAATRKRCTAPPIWAVQ